MCKWHNCVAWEKRLCWKAFFQNYCCQDFSCYWQITANYCTSCTLYYLFLCRLTLHPLLGGQHVTGVHVAAWGVLPPHSASPGAGVATTLTFYSCSRHLHSLHLCQSVSLETFINLSLSAPPTICHSLHLHQSVTHSTLVNLSLMAPIIIQTKLLLKKLVVANLGWHDKLEGEGKTWLRNICYFSLITYDVTFNNK